jgi:serine/threonine-protein kinase RsbW
LKDHVPDELEFPAKPEHLVDVRRRVQELAADTSLTRQDTDDLLTAVDEAVANAIRHGSPNGPKSRVRVSCQSAPTGLTVEVADQGKGFAVTVAPRMPGPEALGGRGLPLMCALADSVEVASGSDGTRITLKKKREPS